MKSYDMSIRSNIFFQSLEESYLEWLAPAISTAHFETDDLIQCQNMPINGLYIIEQGTAISTAAIFSDEVCTVAKMSAGDFFGEFSLLAGEDAAVSIRATTPLDCYFVSQKMFESISNVNLKLGYEIKNHIANYDCKRIRKYNNVILSKADDLKNLNLYSYEGRHQRPIINSMPEQCEREQVITLLSRFDFYEQLSCQDKHFLLDLGGFECYPKNTRLYAEGKSSDTCYYMLQGAVQSGNLIQDEFLKLSIEGPGSVAGGIEFLDGGERINDAYFCENSIVFALSKHSLDKIKQQNAQIYYLLYREIFKTLPKMFKRIYTQFHAIKSSELINEGSGGDV